MESLLATGGVGWTDGTDWWDRLVGGGEPVESGGGVAVQAEDAVRHCHPGLPPATVAPISLLTDCSYVSLSHYQRVAAFPGFRSAFNKDFK